MQTSVYNNQPISLTTFPREDLQRLYEEGKKGNLTCPCCNETVRLYLGIKDKPHFYHILTKNALCQDQIEDIQPTKEPEIKYIERNGFRIPAERVVLTANRQASTYKCATPIAATSTFVRKLAQTSKNQISYILELKEHGFPLDENQLEAAVHVDGPLLVVAGAGSGKTRVLTSRTAYLLIEKQIHPHEIMLVTFTAKAAAEMKTRLLQYPGIHAGLVKSLLAGTFHSIFYRILSFHQPDKWNSTKLLKADWQKEQILKVGGKALHLDEKEFAYDLALQQIGFWKNSLLLPQSIKPADRYEEQVLSLYNHYEQTKLEKQLFDFDDMLIGCYQLFLENPDILTIYQERFRYFLIDEFQDINKVQYELMKMLCKKTNNLCVVGDDDQSIYSFRGSDPKYLLTFEKDFPKSKIITLKKNYRSAHSIVEVANRVIKQNRVRRSKQMDADYDNTYLPTLFYPHDEEEEATMIVQDIAEKLENGYRPNDFAILFRTNTSSRAIFERLANSSFPFRIDQDVDAFYERYIVKGVLAFLRLAQNEEDQTALSHALPFLFVKQSVLADLKANSILEDCTLLDCLSTVKTGHAFQEKKLKQIPALVKGLKGLTPLRAIESLEVGLSLSELLKKRGSEGNKLERGSDDLRDVKVAARNFDTIGDFLDHVSHMTAMNKEMKKMSKQLQDAITLSTIHRAKGLEYKVVYLIQTVDGSVPHDYALEALRNGDSAPLEEERRLLYVAMTRAREELYVSVPEKRRGKKANSSRLLATIIK